MNNTFNIKRFGLTFRKDMIENLKRYLLLFLTLLGLITLLMVQQTWAHFQRSVDNVSLNKQLLIFLSLMFSAAGIWFASTFTTPLNSKLKRLSYLISPASNLEKYLTRWIITTMGFIIAFFTAFWIADALKVTICSAIYPEVEIKFLDLTKLISSDHGWVGNTFVFPKSVFTFFVSLYFLLQSIFLLGSTYWEKASFIKTFTAGAAIITAYILICRWTILLFYDNLDGFANVMGSFEINRTISEVQAINVATIVLSVFTLTFWILAYFRMKESEIIKRF